MLYPLKFQPVYKNLIWGGRNIEKKFKRQIPQGKIGESWEICCRDNGMSVVSNGILKGKSLNEIVKTYKDGLLGTKVYSPSDETFPLLIKIIDANHKLSVQVHPGDEYARKKGIGSGKNEMWYIIDAKPGARLIYGLKKNTSKEDFLKAVENRNIKEFLNEVPVNPGDVFYIPVGTVHAILDGILIAEIQQNSDTTYRLYDWDRVDNNGSSRELHIDKALDVIDFNQSYDPRNAFETYEHEMYTIKELVKSIYFTVEEITVKDTCEDMTDGSKFFIYMIIEGRGIVKYSGGQEKVFSGDTLLIPASLKQYQITGRLKALRIYI